ncbi:MAG: ATP-binding protein [bacterium]|nr:ATP-binding protein [bacterium]
MISGLLLNMESIGVLIICITCIFLGLVVYLKDPKDIANKYFIGFALFSCLIVSSAYVSEFFVNTNEWVTLLLSRITFGSVVGMCITLYFFSLVYPFHIKLSRYVNLLNLFILICATILFIVTVFTSFFATGIKHTQWGFDVITSNAYFQIFLPFSLILLLTSLIIFVRNYFNTYGIKKLQLKYLLLGFGIFVLLEVLFNTTIPIILDNQSLYRIGNYSIIFFVGFIAYGIIKTGLFDIKVVTTETIVILLSLGLLIEVFLSNSVGEGMLKSIVWLLAVFGGFSLIRSVRKEIKQREEMETLAKERERALKEVDERNKNLSTLQKFSDIVLDNNEMKPMIQQIINTIPKEIDECMGVVVALVDQESEKMKGYALSETNLSDGLLDKWKEVVRSTAIPLKNRENLLMMAYHSQKEQKGNNLSDFVSPPLDKTLARELQTKSDIKGLIAIPLSAKDERFGVAIYGLKHPIEDIATEAISMMAAISNEVSLAVQRAIAYENLKKANDYLKDLDQMKDEFISVASHEMNTPLAAIQGYLSMILDEGMGKVDATAKEYLDRVYASSKRLAVLILDLLNVSRIEQGRIHLMYGEIGPEELVQSVIDELSVKSNAKKIYLKFEKPEHKLPQTWIDINRIREVLVNLAGNAIKFTEKGGVTIEAKVDGRSLEFTVSDTGVGIKQEDADKLFKKFSQLNREKNEFQGSGLGLYISKKLVELHSGKIWIESPPAGGGKGAIFKFTLPIVSQKPADPFEGEGAVLTKPTTSDADKIDVKNPMESYLKQVK